MLEILWTGRHPLLGSRGFVFGLVVLAAMLIGWQASGAPPGGPPAWGNDYEAFRLGAQMTLEGRVVEAYDAAVFGAGLPGLTDMYWMYPPHGAMLFAPLGLVPAGPGAILVLGALLAAIWSAGAWAFGDRRGGGLLVLGAVPMLYALKIGQIAPLFGILLVAALAAAPRRPVLAGLLLALLTAKPQYGLLVPVFLLARGQWTTIITAAIGTLVLVGLSLAAFGTEAWTGWLASSEGPPRDFIWGGLYASAPSVFQHARFLGVPPEAAGGLQGAAVLLGAALVWAGRALPYRAHLALTLILACAVMPYLWFYDWLPLLVAVLMLAGGRKAPGGLVPTAWLIALWSAPWASILFEPLAEALPSRLLARALTAGVNLYEAIAIWGVVLLLAYPAIRTTALPVFAPEKRPMKASGPLSSPS